MGNRRIGYKIKASAKRCRPLQKRPYASENAKILIYDDTAKTKCGARLNIELWRMPKRRRASPPFMLSSAQGPGRRTAFERLRRPGKANSIYWETALDASPFPFAMGHDCLLLL